MTPLQTDTFWGLGSTAWTAISAMGTLGAVVVGGAAAVVALGEWRSNNQAQREASRPYVLVTAEPSLGTTDRRLFDLSIRNIGQRPAFELLVKLDPPPARSAAHGGAGHMESLKMLTSPIAMLAPGQDMRAFWDNHADHHEDTGIPQVHNVRLEYKDSAGRTYTNEGVIDLNAMGDAESVTSGGPSADESLASIAKTVSASQLLAEKTQVDVAATIETRRMNTRRQSRAREFNEGHKLRMAIWKNQYLSPERPGYAQGAERDRRAWAQWSRRHPLLSRRIERTF